ncbi:uncharacterized protein [Branchiostoma lanceolatum]|uniref:uncharacterized protein n=1 Tax=Branchiostoma lanceolatum TaxID=7740 RepID=UPI003455C484
MEDALQPPSVVKFINDNARSIWRDMTGVAEESLAQLKSRLHRRGLDNDPPVLRAVRKDGEWWALDNRALYVCLDLERQGKCPRVRIEAVHLNDVPAEVWEGKEFPAKNKILRRRLNGNENCTDTEVPTCRVCHQEFKGYATLATHQSMENHWHGTDGETGGTENDETDAEDSDLEDVSDVNFSDSECDWSEEVGDSDSDSGDESDEEKLDNAQNVNAMRDVTA